MTTDDVLTLPDAFLGNALEREAIARVFVSEDADEGIKAFSEKRKASFKGR